MYRHAEAMKVLGADFDLSKLADIEFGNVYASIVEFVGEDTVSTIVSEAYRESNSYFK